MSGPGTILSQPDFDKLEIVKIGYTSVSSSGSATNWTTIAHNFGYKPLVIAYINDVGVSTGATTIMQDGNIPLPTWADITVDTTNHVVQMQSWLTAMADNTNLYIMLFNSLGTTYNIPVKYYLLRERSS